jgi:GNAT superfamily N-acetyltransferase
VVETRAAVRLRRLGPDDLRAITRIDATHTGQSKPAYWREVLARFRSRGARSQGLGLAAIVDGQVKGFLFGEVRAVEFGSESCGWVFAIGVDPGAQRQGLATALLEGARAHFRAAGVGRIRTMVRRNDVPVLSFFRASGFVGGPFAQLEQELGETNS